jgi:hypothetical protein
MPHINTPPSHQNASTPLGDMSPRLRPLVDSTAASTFSNPSSGCLSDVSCASLFPLPRPQSSYLGLVLLSLNSLELGGFFKLSMWSSIVCKFDNREECGPIVLLEISAYAWVLFKFLIDLFRFSIRLRVEGGGQFLFDS